MRRRFLVSSVRRLLPDHERLVDVVFMWRHRPAMIAVASAGVVVAYVSASLAGIGSVGSHVGLGLAVGLVFSVLWTDYRVLALTDAPRRVLFRAGRVRQVAVEALGDVPPAAEIVAVGSNLFLTEWIVDGERYTVPKRSQAAMARLAAA
ncbi:MAG: hypothetical protein HKN44_00820 [Ilumatobacter sp.]|nr:hypothetical protein [Ilumatobacter sp.]